MPDHQIIRSGTRSGYSTSYHQRSKGSTRSSSYTIANHWRSDGTATQRGNNTIVNRQQSNSTKTGSGNNTISDNQEHNYSTKRCNDKTKIKRSIQFDLYLNISNRQSKGMPIADVRNSNQIERRTINDGK